MAQPTNNPPTDQGAAAPRQALRLARLAIALGLAVAIGIFAVLMVIELDAGFKTYASPTGFGAADGAPTAPPLEAQNRNPLAGLTTTDPSKFIPILRDNPHPGEIVPFLKADPFGQPPYRQPSMGGEISELCVYRVRDGSLTDLIAYYDGQAKRLDMRLARQKPTSDNLPGGVVTTWTDGKNSLQLTAGPLRSSEPTQPPLAPPTPLQWVVKYSYPDPTNAP